MKHCFLIYFLSIILISGCNESQNDLSHMEKENEVENLEYAVYNQTLSLLGEYILFNQNSYSINDKFEIEDFNNRFVINDNGSHRRNTNDSTIHSACSIIKNELLF